MRSVMVGSLRFHICSHALCGPLFWGALGTSRQRRGPPASSVSGSFNPLSFCSMYPTNVRAACRTCTAAAAAASAPAQEAGGTSSDIPGSDGAAFHVIAFCRTAEDATRVQEVAKEVAAEAPADTPTGPALILHLDPVAVPPGAMPELDATECCRLLARSAAEGGTRTMGRVLLAAATLGSTQELLRTHGSVLGDGAVVVADRQTSGKGRGGNQWTSPLGCLMFSALRRLKVSSPSQAPFINYLVCLAIVRGVRRVLQESGLPHLPHLRIKWPNDIYVEGVKVAGALIHTTWQGGSFNVITGIGLNVNNRTPTTCLDELLERAVAAAAATATATAEGQGATSANQGGACGVGGGNGGGSDTAAAQVASGHPHVRSYISRTAVLAGILASLEEVYDIFEQHGFSPLEPEYLATWLHSGQVLDFDDSDFAAAAPASPNTQGGGDGDGNSDGRQRRRVMSRLTIRGLSSSGFLLAEDVEWGGSYELTPDGNSLDMMQGLIRRKVQ